MPIPTQEKPPDPFVLFVRAREGHIVRRFGSSQMIGYTHKADTKEAPAQHSWDTKTIHAITANEMERYGREYTAELFDAKTNPGGGLEQVKREAWEKQRDALTDAKKKRLEDAAKAAKDKPAAPAESGR